MALSVFVISGHLVVGSTPTTGPRLGRSERVTYGPEAVIVAAGEDAVLIRRDAGVAQSSDQDAMRINPFAIDRRPLPVAAPCICCPNVQFSRVAIHRPRK